MGALLITNNNKTTYTGSGKVHSSGQTVHTKVHAAVTAASQRRPAVRAHATDASRAFPVEIRFTDASAKHWPTTDTFHPESSDPDVPKKTGMTALVQIDNVEANQKLRTDIVALRERAISDWKKKVGTHLAAIHTVAPGDTLSSLTALPDGYGLFQAPRKAAGQFDTYLFGSKLVRNFRSPEEFFPHAEWLFLGCIPNTCACQYCNRGRSEELVPRVCACWYCANKKAPTSSASKSRRGSQEKGELGNKSRDRKSDGQESTIKYYHAQKRSSSPY